MTMELDIHPTSHSLLSCWNIVSAIHHNKQKMQSETYLASLQKLLECGEVKFTGEHLDDDLHQVVLCDGVFAADHLFQHAWQHAALVVLHGDAFEVTEAAEVGANQNLPV